MNIIKPGSTVNIDLDIKGIVSEVLIGNNDSVRYKVSWWNGRSRSHEWFDSFEVDVYKKDQKKTIGFVCYDV